VRSLWIESKGSIALGGVWIEPASGTPYLLPLNPGDGPLIAVSGESLERFYTLCFGSLVEWRALRRFQPLITWAQGQRGPINVLTLGPFAAPGDLVCFCVCAMSTGAFLKEQGGPPKALISKARRDRSSDPRAVRSRRPPTSPPSQIASAKNKSAAVAQAMLSRPFEEGGLKGKRYLVLEFEPDFDPAEHPAMDASLPERAEGREELSTHEGFQALCNSMKMFFNGSPQQSADAVASLVEFTQRN